MTQPVESSVYVAPSQTMPGAQPMRQLLVFEYNAATGVYVQQNVEVIAAADPMTGLPARLATSEQMEDVIKLLRANLRIGVMMLNQLAGREGSQDEEDFLRADEADT